MVLNRNWKEMMMEATEAQMKAIQILLKRNEKLILWRPTTMDALPEGYIAGAYCIKFGDDPRACGIDPDGSVSP